MIGLARALEEMANIKARIAGLHRRKSTQRGAIIGGASWSWGRLGRRGRRLGPSQLAGPSADPASQDSVKLEQHHCRESRQNDEFENLQFDTEETWPERPA